METHTFSTYTTSPCNCNCWHNTQRDATGVILHARVLLGRGTGFYSPINLSFQSAFPFLNAQMWTSRLTSTDDPYGLGTRRMIRACTIFYVLYACKGQLACVCGQFKRAIAALHRAPAYALSHTALVPGAWSLNIASAPTHPHTRMHAHVCLRAHTHSLPLSLPLSLSRARSIS